jgi:hypothetical protein
LLSVYVKKEEEFFVFGEVKDLEKLTPFKGFIDSVNVNSTDVYVAAYQSIKDVDSPENL